MFSLAKKSKKKPDKVAADLVPTLACLQQIVSHNYNLKLPLINNLNTTDSGNTIQLQHGYGIEFSHLRPYQYGDDIRHINWRVSARSKNTQLNVYNLTSDRPVVIAAERSSNLYFASKGELKSILAAKIMAALIGITRQQDLRLGFADFAADTACTYVRPSKNQQNILKFLAKFTEVTANSDPALKDNLKILSKVLPQSALLFVLVDINSVRAEIESELIAIKSRADLHLILIYDEFDAELPQVNKIKLQNYQDKTVSLEINSAMRQQYQQKWQAKVKQLQTIGQKHKISMTFVNTKLDYLTAVNKIMQQLHQGDICHNLKS